MPSDKLSKALSRNKYCIVKRTLRLTGTPSNDTDVTDFTDAASLTTIETTLMAGIEPSPAENGNRWLMRLFTQ